VLNSVAASRRLAWRAVAMQAAVALVTAALWLPAGREAALGALVGGGVVALGGAVSAWAALPGRPAAAGVALGRLLGGMALKWAVLFGGLVLALGVWHLPAPAVLTGAVAAIVMFVFAARLWT
jgi:F0F1-type ATP synthase assembly protein I